MSDELPSWPPDFVRRIDDHVLNDKDEQLFWDWAEARGQLSDAWRAKTRLPPSSERG